MSRLTIWFLTTICLFSSLDARHPEKAILQITFQDPGNRAKIILRSASFQGENIRLRPRSPNGIRAILHKNLLPGSYILRWTVEKNGSQEITEKTQTRTIEIGPEDIWVDVLVEGERFILL
ncbi:MAG: hypothetical protein AAGF04_05275 [Chlamydiota bacterium]